MIDVSIIELLLKWGMNEESGASSSELDHIALRDEADTVISVAQGPRTCTAWDLAPLTRSHYSSDFPALSIRIR